MKLVFTYLLVLLALCAVAQQGMDTIQVSEVEIVSSIEVVRARQGSFNDFKYWRDKRLDELLMSNTSTFIKSYGSGQLASISVRGSTAAQTDILWNGVRMNQPSLGQIDLSLFNAGIAELITIAPASGNSTAIGGAIDLSSNAKYSTNTVTGSIRYGSFKTFQSYVGVQYSKGRIWGSTKFSYLSAANNFKYRDLFKPGNPYTTQKNAAVSLLSFTTQLSIKVDTHNTVTAYLWINGADRNIAPIMSKPDSREHQYDEGIRTMLNWAANYGNYAKGSWVIGFTSAYLNDKMRYINPEAKLDATTHSQVVRNIFNIAYKYRRFELKTWLNYDYEWIDIASYNQIRSRNLSGIKLEALFRSKKGIDLTLNLAQDLLNKQLSPFSPSLAIKYRYQQQGHSFNLTLLGKRAFRFPTFNDLYWVPGGNPNLKTEKAWKGEATAAYYLKGLFYIKATGFCTYASNWIQWVPQGSIWTAVNYKRVLSRGFETYLSLTNTNAADAKFVVDFTASYSYTKTTNLDGLNANDQSKGKQLIYVPLHSVAAGLQLQYYRFYIRSSNNYVSTLYTSTDNSQSLKGYFISNLEVGKDFVFGTHEVSASFRINNIGNADYQSVAQRPMPGRAYEGIIRFKFAQK